MDLEAVGENIRQKCWWKSKKHSLKETVSITVSCDKSGVADTKAIQERLRQSAGRISWLEGWFNRFQFVINDTVSRGLSYWECKGFNEIFQA